MADHNDNRALEPGSEELRSDEMASWVKLQHQEFELQRQEFNLRQQEAMGNLEYAREALKIESRIVVGNELRITKGTSELRFPLRSWPLR